MDEAIAGPQKNRGARIHRFELLGSPSDSVSAISTHGLQRPATTQEPFPTHLVSAGIAVARIGKRRQSGTISAFDVLSIEIVEHNPRKMPFILIKSVFHFQKAPCIIGQAI